MKLYRIILFTLLTLLIFKYSIAQNTANNLLGKAIDQNGHIVPGILLFLEGTDHWATSNVQGFFKFKNIPKGEYILQVTGMGFKSQQRHLDLNKEEFPILEILLEEDVQQLQEFLIEGLSVKKEIERSGFAVNVLETKNAGFRSMQTNDLLDRSAGVRVRQNGGLGSAVNYDLNGMSGNSVRIFIDGIPLSNYGPSFNLNSIPLHLLNALKYIKE